MARHLVLARQSKNYLIPWTKLTRPSSKTFHANPCPRGVLVSALYNASSWQSRKNTWGLCHHQHRLKAPLESRICTLDSNKSSVLLLAWSFANSPSGRPELSVVPGRSLFLHSRQRCCCNWRPPDSPANSAKARYKRVEIEDVASDRKQGHDKLSRQAAVYDSPLNRSISVPIGSRLF